MSRKIEVPDEMTPREELQNSVSELTDVKRAEMELIKDYREIEIDPYGKIRIYRPTIEDDYQADLVFTDEMNRLLRSNPNIPTQEEQEQMLESRGIWTKAHKDEVERIKEELSELSTELFLAKEEYKKNKTSKNKKKITDLNNEYDSLRKQFMKMQSVSSKYFGATVEGRAEEKRFLVRMSSAVKNVDGERIWSSTEDLAKERDSEPVRRIVYEFIAFLQGVDTQVLAELPDLFDEVGEEASEQ